MTAKSLLTPIILCGVGSNLYPLCDASADASATKALLPLANRPMLAFALQNVLSAGLSSCIVLAPFAHHTAIVRALSSVRLIPPPNVQNVTLSDKRRAKDAAKDDRLSVSITFEDVGATDESSSTFASPSSGCMRVELLALGPHDGTFASARKSSSEKEQFRLGPLGTAELLRWLDSMGKLQADPLVLPVDLLAPVFPLHDLIDAYVQAQARYSYAPTACCALYEREAGEGVGREREREGPPRLISAFSIDNEPRSLSHRLLLLRDSDLTDDLDIRRSLLRNSPHLRISTNLLDAHVYIFNRSHVLPLLKGNPKLTSLRDHVLPLIAKASWQHGLRYKAGWTLPQEEILRMHGEQTQDEMDDEANASHNNVSQHTQVTSTNSHTLQNESIARSSRYTPSRSFDGREKGSRNGNNEEIRCQAVIVRLDDSTQATPTNVQPNALPSFAARANTVATYLESNRWLLKALSGVGEEPIGLAIPEIDVSGTVINDASALSTASTIASSAQISQDSLLGHGTNVGERASVKRSVIGHGCEVGRGARLSGCILMDGVKVGENAKLENVICCANSRIGDRSSLKDCDVAAGLTVSAETNAKNEKLVGENDDEDEDEDEEDTHDDTHDA